MTLTGAILAAGAIGWPLVALVAMRKGHPWTRALRAAGAMLVIQGGAMLLLTPAGMAFGIMDWLMPLGVLAPLIHLLRRHDRP